MAHVAKASSEAKITAESGEVGLQNDALGVVGVRLLQLVRIREQRRLLQTPHYRASELRYLRVHFQYVIMDLGRLWSLDLGRGCPTSVPIHTQFKHIICQKKYMIISPTLLHVHKISVLARFGTTVVHEVNA